MYRFICAPHRKAMIENPEMAKVCCWKGLETGLNLKAFGQHREALAHLGCAFESAEIILSSQSKTTLDTIGLFNSTCCALIQSLKALGYDQQWMSILDLAVDRLLLEATQSPHHHNVIQTLVVSLQHFASSSESSSQEVNRLEQQIDELNFNFHVNPEKVVFH